MIRSASPSVSQICHRLLQDAGDQSKASVSLRFVPLSRSHLHELALALSRCRHVTKISIHHCLWSMPSEGEDELEDEEEYETSSFHPVSLSGTLLQTLASCCWLEQIDLPENHLTRQHLYSYVQALTTVANYSSAAPHQLQKLNFSYNSAMGDSGMRLLATRALSHLPVLTELKVTGCGITDDGMYALLTASTTTNPHLHVLVADDNPGLQLVAPMWHKDDCVLSKTPLKTLSLKDTGIGDEGLLVLANALVTNTSLTVVKLQGIANSHRSDGRGLRRLLQVLQSDNVTLQSVGIDSTTGPHDTLIDCLAIQCRANLRVRTMVERLLHRATKDSPRSPSAPLTDIPAGGWSRVFARLSGQPKLTYHVLREYPDVTSHGTSPDRMGKALEPYSPSDQRRSRLSERVGRAVENRIKLSN